VKTVAVIPARMGSSRLPGKVMIPVLGKPLLGVMLDRIQRCSLLDEVVVATSTGVDNDAIETYCNQRNVLVFRGSENDVLDRLTQALIWREAQTGVLLFGDCPLIDPTIITRVVTYFNAHPEYDFVSNDLVTSWPPGMEVEVFRVSTLIDSRKRCTDMSLREHSTLHIRLHSDVYCLYNLEAPANLRRPGLSLEVDVDKDLIVIESLLKAFGGHSDFTLEDMISYVDENPSVEKVNHGVERRWKQYRDNQS